jgi:membrane-associated phospholipid phosphatase
MRHPGAVLAVLLIALQCGVAGYVLAQQSTPSRPLSDFGTPSIPTATFALPYVEPSSRISAPLEVFQDLGRSAGNGAVGFGRNLFEDLSLQFRAPFNYASQHPVKFVAGAAGILVLITTDHLTHPALTGNLRGSPTQRDMHRVGEAGDAINGLYLIAGMGIVGIVAGSSREKSSSVMLAEALLTSAFWTASIKAVTGRERPREVEEQRSDWEGPDFLNDDRSETATLRSFPSGHSTGAWATATVLAHQYPKYGVVPVLAYGGATLMSYSRLVVGAHWLSDVVVGALIGVGSARVVMSAHEQRKSRSHDKKTVRVGFDVSSQYKGMHIRYNF